MSRKLSARLACGFLAIHGLFEVAGVLAVTTISETLVNFGGMHDPAQIADQAIPIVVLGVMWGITRFIAVWGIWTSKEWGVALGIIVSTVSLIAAVMIMPAGVVDTALATPALILLLYTWLGHRRIEM